MALGKKISRLLRHSDKSEKDAATCTIQPIEVEPLPPLCEAVTVSTTAQDDELIMAATQASLQDQIRRLEDYIQAQASQLSSQAQTNSHTELEISALNSMLASAQAENARLRAAADRANLAINEVSSLREVVQEKANRVHTLEEQKTRLERENGALQNDKKSLYDGYQRLEANRQQMTTLLDEQSRKRHDLECRLSYSLQPMGGDARRAFEERCAWMREREELERRFQEETEQLNQQLEALTRNLQAKESEQEELERRFQEEREQLNQRLESLTRDFQAKENERVAIELSAATLQETLEQQEASAGALQAALEEEREQHRDARGIIQALQDNEELVDIESEEIQRQLTQLMSLFGSAPTPRQVLFLKHFVKKFPRSRRAEDDIEASAFSISHDLEDLTVIDLDNPLTEPDFAQFIQSASSGSRASGACRIKFKRCKECCRHKVDSLFHRQNRSLVEFPKEYANSYPCASSICKDCLIAKLRTSITQDWWYDLDSDQWLKCPVAGCEHALNIRGTEALENILEDYPLGMVAQTQQLYAFSCALRRSLALIEPRFNMEEISSAVELYKQLSAFGIFKSPLPASPPAEYDPTELIDVGEVLVGSLDRDNLKIPVFTKFFQHSEASKDCSICLESYHDLAIESEEQWKDICEGYHGDWMTELFPFPSSDSLQCDTHDDAPVCKRCIKHHLESQLEQHGWNSRGRLSCPVCNRALSENELRRLASKETVQKYDHYLLLSHLSSDPNFRRCLRAGCDDGQIYEQDEYPNPHIVCNSCDFEMCFSHQTPWHTGLSCDQYDSQREHGDPEYQQTQQWMQSNSKNCPGRRCGVNIEKGNACFHMTCTQCRHEFCWECLADWSRINPEPGTYVKEAHNHGCWFRDSDLEPTQISGTDLQGALRRRGIR